LSVLSTFVQERLEEVDLGLKQASAEFVKHYEEIAEGKTLSQNTIYPKLRRIGEEEGERFFFDREEARVEALARTLGVTAQVLLQVYRGDALEAQGTEPQLYDLFDESGVPLLPHPQLTKRFKEDLRLYHKGHHVRDPPMLLRIQEALDNGREPTYTLYEVIENLPLKRVRCERPQNLSWALVNEESTEPTYIWWEGRNIFILGYQRAQFESMFVKHAPLHSPNVLQPLERATRHRNPWLMEYEEFEVKDRWDRKLTKQRFIGTFQTIARDLYDETGFVYDALLVGWAADARKNPISADSELEPLTRHHIQRDHESRSHLMRIFSREFSLQADQAKWLFLFEQLCHAPVLTLPTSEPNHFHLMVYIGGGWVWRVSWIEYEERASPIRFLSGHQDLRPAGADGIRTLELGADDLHLWLSSERVPTLGFERGQGSTPF